MGKSILLGAVGAIFGLIGFHSVGGLGDMGADADSGYSAHMRGCLRQMRGVTPSEEQALSACECMYSEFEKRDLSLTDAFGNDFDQMSMITRECAAQNGAVL